MYKPTTSVRIVDYLKHRDYTPLYILEDKAHEWNTTGSTIAKRCRELAVDLKRKDGSVRKAQLDKMLVKNIHGALTISYRHKNARVPVYSPYQEMVRQDQEKNEVLL